LHYIEKAVGLFYDYRLRGSMKKIIIVIAVVLFFTLTACKVSSTDEVAQKSVETPVPDWNYTWVSARCVYDGGSEEVVCVKLSDGDNTYLGTLVTSMLQKGWELDDILHTSDPGGMIQTFIFRQPYVISTAQE